LYASLGRAACDAGETTGSWRVKFCRSPLLAPLLGVAFLALSSCGRQSEPADVSSTQSPAPAESASSSSSASSSNKITPAKPGWTTSYEEGQQDAKANNKLVLLDFTGSDWCGWCILLEREVFSKPQFKEYASKNLVLVELDFPQRKPMPDAIKMQNVKLARRFQVQGFPTIIVLNGDGQMVGELGYMKGGPEAYIKVLERLRKG
jgi:protein disulfide-isomerase